MERDRVARNQATLKELEEKKRRSQRHKQELDSQVAEHEAKRAEKPKAFLI